MSDQIHYTRMLLPEDGGTDGNFQTTEMALSELLTYMGRNGADPVDGRFRITYDLNSTLERTSVLAEWRPNK